MNKDQLKKLIRDSVQSVANEYLIQFGKEKDINNTDKFLNSDNISEDDFDNQFFFGGVKKPELEKKKSAVFIQESNDNANLKITTSEIKDFENSFKQILDKVPGATIVFDKQKNGYSIAAVKRQDGVEAKASGILNLGDKGKIIWSYSILNGFNVNAQNLKLSDSNKLVFEELTNHYNDWQKKWRDKLNLPGAPKEQGENELGSQEPVAPPLNGMDAAGGLGGTMGAAPATAGQTGTGAGEGGAIPPPAI